MIFEDSESLTQRIIDLTDRPVIRKPKVFEDTSAFMSIDGGDVIRLGGHDYLVLGNAREGRFGIDDQPKFWVKTALDLTANKRKIIKLVFEETFTSRIGTEVFQCLRSAEKEAAVLRAMNGHPHFMQGESVRDTVGNLVRVLDFIPGPSLYEYLRKIKMSHKDYYQKIFPEMMQLLIGSIEAIALLHRQRLHHGDIRADHILLEKPLSSYRWIDFDYQVNHPYYDMYCLGNVLLQVVGKGRHSTHDIKQHPARYPDLQETLKLSDMSLMFPHRAANLCKLFPHIPVDLNEILMRFSTESACPYQDPDTLLSDLRSLFPSG
jgi:serine/threonine protein kinase